VANSGHDVYRCRVIGREAKAILEGKVEVSGRME